MKYAALLVTLSLFGCRAQEKPLVPEAKWVVMPVQLQGQSGYWISCDGNGKCHSSLEPDEPRRIATRQDFLGGEK